MSTLGVSQHEIRFTSTVVIEDPGPASKTAERIYQLVKRLVFLYVL